MVTKILFRRIPTHPILEVKKYFSTHVLWNTFGEKHHHPPSSLKKEKNNFVDYFTTLFSHDKINNQLFLMKYFLAYCTHSIKKKHLKSEK